jgi:hypothetical protein
MFLFFDEFHPQLNASLVALFKASNDRLHDRVYPMSLAFCVLPGPRNVWFVHFELAAILNIPTLNSSDGPSQHAVVVVQASFRRAYMGRAVRFRRSGIVTLLSHAQVREQVHGISAPTIISNDVAIR